MTLSSLELKMPPPLLGILLALLMAYVSLHSPAVPLPAWFGKMSAAGLIVTGFVLMVSGIVVFRRHVTTVNPMTPHRSVVLVTTGLFAWTRNPMYVGVVTMLLGWSIALASPATLLGPLFFFLYIDRFQVVPEERFLLARFGDEYRAYQARVRRWF